MILLGFQCLHQMHSVIGRIHGKISAVPVVFKSRVYLTDGVGLVMGGYFQIPFKAAGHGGVGHIRRANVSRSEACVTIENIRFRMKPCAFGVVGNFYLGMGQFAQSIPLAYNVIRFSQIIFRYISIPLLFAKSK